VIKAMNKQYLLKRKKYLKKALREARTQRFLDIVSREYREVEKKLKTCNS